MSKLTNKSGFTLLEILVVVIIVGVLASVAMPQLFRNVERSRSTEALNTLGVVKRSAEACASQFNNNYVNCANFNNIGMPDPSTLAGSHFTYTFGAAGVNNITIRATRNALDSGTVGDTVNLVVTAATITKSGNGAFIGIQ